MYVCVCVFVYLCICVCEREREGYARRCALARALSGSALLHPLEGKVVPVPHPLRDLIESRGVFMICTRQVHLFIQFVPDAVSGDSGSEVSGLDDSGFGVSGLGNSGFGDSGLGDSRFGASGVGDPGFGVSGIGDSGFWVSGLGNSGFWVSALGDSGFGVSGLGCRVQLQQPEVWLTERGRVGVVCVCVCVWLSGQKHFLSRNLLHDWESYYTTARKLLHDWGMCLPCSISGSSKKNTCPRIPAGGIGV